MGGGGGHYWFYHFFLGGGGEGGGGWRALSFDISILSRGQINFEPTPIFVNKNSSFALPELAFVKSHLLNKQKTSTKERRNLILFKRNSPFFIRAKNPWRAWSFLFLANDGEDLSESLEEHKAMTWWKRFGGGFFCLDLFGRLTKKNEKTSSSKSIYLSKRVREGWFLSDLLLFAAHLRQTGDNLARAHAGFVGQTSLHQLTYMKHHEERKPGPIPLFILSLIWVSFGLTPTHPRVCREFLSMKPFGSWPVVA